MTRTRRFALMVGGATVALAAGAFALVPAQSTQQDKQPPSEQQFELPPGWTMDDMMKYAEAGTPGPMHEFLRKGAGTWDAKTTMWMTPDADPITAPGVSTVTPIMDGRFVKVEMSGEMPGMGSAYSGFGIYGYDNVTRQFQSTWIDNHSTGMMRGTGKLSEDGNTLTWEFIYHCPIRDEPCKFREIERITGRDTKTLEMHGSDPKTGVEYKMMEIAFTRRAG